MHRLFHLLIVLIICFSCKENANQQPFSFETYDSSYAKIEINDNPGGDTLPGNMEITEPNQTKAGGFGADTANPANLLNYAGQFLGIPYKYASANPSEGFDCSGFLYYVFHHFNIDVPRSSRDYMNFGTPIPESEAKPGDFILFTGTDSSIRMSGHVGLITGKRDGVLEFIHSSSGKANGVTITPLNDYYRGRFLKCIRILELNK